jgi:hypothetical protein
MKIGNHPFRSFEKCWCNFLISFQLGMPFFKNG